MRPSPRYTPALLLLLLCLGLVVTDPGTAAESPIRVQALAVLRAGLASEDFWPSMHAAEALSRASFGAEVRASLQARLLHERDDQRRCGLARELYRAGDTSAAATLFEVLASANTHGHVHAAESLYKLRLVGDSRALDAAFAQQSSPRLRLMAAGALAAHGDAAAMRFVREALQGADTGSVRTAAWLLGSIGEAQDVPALRSALDRETDAATSLNIALALAVLGDPAGLHTLKKALRAPEASTRAHAATAASEIPADAELTALLAQLLRDPDLDVRIRAAQALLTPRHSC